MINPRSIRTIRALSRRMTSIWRASRPQASASRRANDDGSISLSRTSRPSALETILCVTTTISPPWSKSPRRSSASVMSATRSSPGRTSGMPSRPIISRSLDRSNTLEAALVRMLNRHADRDPLLLAELRDRRCRVLRSVVAGCQGGDIRLGDGRVVDQGGAPADSHEAIAVSDTDRDPGIAAQVFLLQPSPRRVHDALIVAEQIPHHRLLWHPISTDRRQDRKAHLFQEVAGLIAELAHRVPSHPFTADPRRLEAPAGMSTAAGSTSRLNSITRQSWARGRRLVCRVDAPLPAGYPVPPVVAIATRCHRARRGVCHGHASALGSPWRIPNQSTNTARLSRGWAGDRDHRQSRSRARPVRRRGARGGALRNVRRCSRGTGRGGGLHLSPEQPPCGMGRPRGRSRQAYLV